MRKEEAWKLRGQGFKQECVVNRIRNSQALQRERSEKALGPSSSGGRGVLFQDHTTEGTVRIKLSGSREGGGRGECKSDPTTLPAGISEGDHLDHVRRRWLRKGGRRGN